MASSGPVQPAIDRLSSMTLKAVFTIAAGLVGAGAVAIHLYAPDLMRNLGHMIHGGR